MAGYKSKKKKKPAFNQLNLGHKKRVKDSWRKPRGTHNKKRMKMKWAGAHPRIGYGTPADIHSLHPIGKVDALVHNLSELEALKGKDALVRLSSVLGGKKRAIILEKAKSMGLTVLNSGIKKEWKKAPKKEKAPSSKKVK